MYYEIYHVYDSVILSVNLLFCNIHMGKGWSVAVDVLTVMFWTVGVRGEMKMCHVISVCVLWCLQSHVY